MLPKILDKSEVEHRIGYHPKCKYLALTHLKFADDILVFMVKLGQLRVFRMFSKRLHPYIA